MQAHWLNKEGNSSIIVFVLGWASDWPIADNILPKGYDAVCIYDYRGIGHYIDSDRMDDFLLNNDIKPESYGESYLVAWSFGVWVSEMLFKNTEFSKAIALNGTPFPVHDLFGIPTRVMDVTIHGLMKSGMELFDKRTYGEHSDKFPHKHYSGTKDDYVYELELLNEYARAEYHPAIKWDKAIIGTEDKIFPVENMKRYWNTLGDLLPLQHFPFINSEIITNWLRTNN